MKSEKKRVIALGSDKPFPEKITGKGIFLLNSADQQLHACLYGVNARLENDVEFALQSALLFQNPEQKFVIKPVDVLIENGIPRFDLEHAFQKEIDETLPGETWVDSTTAKIYGRLFLFEKAEDKGQKLFFLRSKRSRPKPLHGFSTELAPFIGRKKELKKLEEWIDQIKEDQGQIVSLVGPAGMGKTRLTTAFKEWLQEKEIPYFEGGHSPQQGQFYLSFRQILEQLKKSKNYKELFSNLTPMDEALLSLLLHPGAPIPGLANLKEAEIRKGIFEAAEKIVIRAGEKPIVFIFEDFHWAESRSVELLNSVLTKLESLHILILVLHRPEFIPPWKKLLNYNQLELKPFHKKELEELLKTLLSVQIISSRFLEHFNKLSMGNPLFMEELLRQLFETGVVEIEEGNHNQRYLRVHETQMESIPSTLHSIIATRFDALSNDERETLRWASLLGVRFYVNELEGFLKTQNIENLQNIVESLFEKNFIRERSSFPQKIYEFSHDMIYEVVLESTPERERKRQHTQMARFLKHFYQDRIEIVIDRIAEHFLQGEPQLEAFQVAIRAGEIMSNSHQYERALYFYREASKSLEKQNLS